MKTEKLAFPRIIKVRCLPKEIAKDLGKHNYQPDDLLIVRVTVTYADGKNTPAHYGFEKIEGTPVEYLLKRCEEYREKNANLIRSLPSADQ